MKKITKHILPMVESCRITVGVDPVPLSVNLVNDELVLYLSSKAGVSKVTIGIEIYMNEQPYEDGPITYIGTIDRNDIAYHIFF